MLSECRVSVQIEEESRYRELLGARAWNSLPGTVRQRFGKQLKAGASVVYQGIVVAMRMNLAGRVLAQLARLVGGPLPHDLSSMHQAAVVSVTQDIAGDGQFWIRQYGRASGFPQVIHSSKRFAGPTGIEEYIGCGIGIALKLRAEQGALLFESDHYFIDLGGWKVRFPKWMKPGQLTITHRDLGHKKFRFSLDLKSRYLGELLHQDAIFWDKED